MFKRIKQDFSCRDTDVLGHCTRDTQGRYEGTLRCCLLFR